MPPNRPEDDVALSTARDSAFTAISDYESLVKSGVSHSLRSSVLKSTINSAAGMYPFKESLHFASNRAVKEGMFRLIDSTEAFMKATPSFKPPETAWRELHLAIEFYQVARDAHKRAMQEKEEEREAKKEADKLKRANARKS
ncbi:hypothetical protein B0H11DRAFT_1923779 [Mycena galericulata]|nr:hypothetical protein B0H11DRAFT_1923779 [Mycena galericulata]